MTGKQYIYSNYKENKSIKELSSCNKLKFSYPAESLQPDYVKL